MLSEWLLFLLKGVTAAVIVVAALVMLAAALRGLKTAGAAMSRENEEGRLEVKPLRQERDSLRSQMESVLDENRADGSSPRAPEDRNGQESAKALKDEKAPEQQAKPDEAAQADKQASAPDGKAQESGKKAEKKRKALKPRMLEKERDDEQKQRLLRIEKARKEGKFCPRDLYVIEFSGDVKASETEELRREIDAVLEYGGPEDELVVVLDSPGGMVNAYGFGASQLMRVRDRGIKLTVCVDKVAASGGYMMAAVADRIVAAPFAYVGSIGVVAEFPNVNRFLTSHDIDYEQVTSGKYKRTLTMLGRNTPEAREKFKQELEAVHRQFKSEVARFRPQIDMERVATGEHWLAQDALELKLVDAIGTSDDYIRERTDLTSGCALKLGWKYDEKKSILKKILGIFSAKSWVRAVSEEISEQAAGRGGVIR